jgi:hypothetical protein
MSTSRDSANSPTLYPDRAKAGGRAYPPTTLPEDLKLDSGLISSLLAH